MKMIDDLRINTINNVIRSATNFSKFSIVNDGSTFYVELRRFVASHKRKDKVGEKLLWNHIAVSNAKRKLANSYHNVKPDFFQSYLYMFCYKF